MDVNQTNQAPHGNLKGLGHPQEIAGLMKGLLKGIMVVTQPSIRPDFPGGDV